MQFMRSLAKAVVLEIEIPSLLEASTASTTGVDMSAYEGTAFCILHSAAGTGGANETMDVKVQHCATTDGTYADVSGATFDQVDDTAGGSCQGIAIDLDPLNPFLKFYFTIAGTTPDFTCSACVVAFPKSS